MHRVARILVVDDEPANTVLLENLLTRRGYSNVNVTNDSTKALALCETLDPDLLMLDLHMPRVDGFEILEALPDPADGVRLPVIVLTADASRETKRRALATGAHDLVTKPFDIDEIILRVEHLLYTRKLELSARDRRQLLEDRVVERTEDVERAHRETIHRLAAAAEYRDDAVGEHIFRVARTTAQLADAMGQDPVVVELFRCAATLHDVGKIAIPDHILLKPGKLDDEEWGLMKEHTTKGAEILSGSNSQVLTAAAEIALMHHERWDGTGYPNGLAGEEISLAGRIVAISDVFDALTQRRPYKEAWGISDALGEIESQSGSQFDPDVVDAFFSLDPESLVAPLQETDRTLL